MNAMRITAFTDDDQPASCVGVAAGAARDRCEWSNLLKGASEKSGGANIGAMIGARGCIEEIQAMNPTTGTCTPGIYRITVAWQGLTPVSAPASNCGSGLYGANDAHRRAASLNVTVGLPTCLPL